MMSTHDMKGRVTKVLSRASVAGAGQGTTTYQERPEGLP